MIICCDCSICWTTRLAQKRPKCAFHRSKSPWCANTLDAKRLPTFSGLGVFIVDWIIQITETDGRGIVVEDFAQRFLDKSIVKFSFIVLGKRGTGKSVLVTDISRKRSLRDNALINPPPDTDPLALPSGWSILLSDIVHPEHSGTLQNLRTVWPYRLCSRGQEDLLLQAL